MKQIISEKFELYLVFQLFPFHSKFAVNDVFWNILQILKIDECHAYLTDFVCQGHIRNDLKWGERRES